MKSKLSLIPLSFLVLFTAANAAAQQKEAKPKPVLCAVVQIDDEYRVIKKDEVSALKKQLKDEHKAALESHKLEVKAAKKRKEKGKIPAPKARKFKLIKPSIEEVKAEVLVAELKAKAEQKKNPKPKRAKAKPIKKTKEKPTRKKK